MSLEEFIKQIKKLNNVQIKQEIKDNNFYGYIQGIINNMEKKKSKLDQIIDELKEIKFDIIELKSDVKHLKSEAIKHGWDINLS